LPAEARLESDEPLRDDAELTNVRDGEREPPVMRAKLAEQERAGLDRCAVRFSAVDAYDLLLPMRKHAGLSSVTRERPDGTLPFCAHAEHAVALAGRATMQKSSRWAQNGRARMTESIELPGGTVRYECAGDGPVVILVHALGPRAWGWPLERLARGCTVIAMGGLEPAAHNPSYVSEIDRVLGVVRRIGCKQFTLCAWSMAGLATIAYAAAQPPELEKLVLVDVAGLGGPLMKRPPAEPPRSAAEWAKRRAASWVHEPGPVRDLVEALDLEELTRTPQAFQRIMEDNRQVRQAPPPLELEKVAVPTLVLAGRHSLVMGPDAAQGAARRLRHGTVVIFEQSAHALALEEAENFQNVVAQFVLGKESPPSS
jgi:3-oxoadipate enol-lactonase